MAKRFAPYDAGGGITINPYTSITNRVEKNESLAQLWLDSPLHFLVGHGPANMNESVGDITGPAMIIFRFGFIVFLGFVWINIQALQKAWGIIHNNRINFFEQVLAISAIAFFPSWWIVSMVHYTFMADFQYLAPITYLIGLVEVVHDQFA